MILAAVVVTGCSSRYRLDLYMDLDGHRKKVKIEQTQYVMDADLVDPYADDKVAVGRGNVAVITIGTRGERVGSSTMKLFGFDEYWKCQIYMQLPPVPKPDTVGLADASFVHLLGHYDLPIEDKMFFPTSGVFVVDSVTTSKVFLSIDGQYENRTGTQLGFDGRVKIRVDR